MYCYRNPQDWAVSFFDHSASHVDEKLRYYQDGRSNRCRITDPVMLLKTVGLNSYIKQFYTYHVMKELFSDNIRLVRYEHLVRHPAQVFTDNLAFIGHDATDASRQANVRRALQASSIATVRSIEAAAGRSLANDQDDPKGSHVRGGAVGKWKTVFQAADVDYLEKRLKEFNIEVDQFTFE